jgi:hypothetical protein
MDEPSADFERWVPLAARQAINELRAQTEDQHRRMILDRLANNPIMRTDVWERMPPEVHGRENEVVVWAYGYVCAANNFVPPMPIRKKDFKRWQTDNRRSLARSSLTSVATLADLLLQAMADTVDDARVLHPADSSKTIDEMREQVCGIRDAYRRMVEAKAALDGKFPIFMPHKRRSKSARQTMFTVSMSARFQELFGSPLDEVVAALTSVVFDLKGGGPEVSAIRGRRRWASPADYKKKAT